MTEAKTERGKNVRERRRRLPTNHASCHEPDAFTFVELMIVVAILGVVSAVAVPRFTDMLSRTRLHEAARRVKMDFALARQQAILTGTPQTVLFNISSDNYQLVGMNDFDQSGQGYVVSLAEEPYQVTLTSAVFGTNSTVIFDAYGVPDSAGVVGLRTANRQINITLNGQTGKANVGNIVLINAVALPPIDPNPSPPLIQ